MPKLEDPTHYQTKPTSAMQHTTTRAMPMPADQTAEITRLRRENDQLRYERDTLKKSLAIFAGAPT
jgi:transposase